MSSNDLEIGIGAVFTIDVDEVDVTFGNGHVKSDGAVLTSFIGVSVIAQQQLYECAVTLTMGRSV